MDYLERKRLERIALRKYGTVSSKEARKFIYGKKQETKD